MSPATPFVLLALHTQPERSTSPNGGPYVYQERIAALLAKYAPAGWEIVVKEHPSQFQSYRSSERGRTIAFYDTLAALPRVRMVAPEESPFELLDRARAVATVSGMIAWEAIARGVPALAFGDAWYEGCEGIFRVRSDTDCEHALARIAAGDRPNSDRVALFLAVAEEVGFQGYIDQVTEKILGIPPSENAASLANALHRHWTEAHVGAR